MFSTASNISELVNNAFLVFLVICVALLALITFLMIFFVVKYHSSRHKTPEDVEGNTLLEVVWTVIPTIIVMGMFYFGWVGYKAVLQGAEDAMQVTVTGRMWEFQFTYENGVTSDELRLPVGTEVKLLLRSTDVLHSFYVPAFRVKQDLVPGKDNQLWVTPVNVGTFDLFCAEYCGDRHSYMYTNVIVMEKDEFDEWLEDAGRRLEAAEGGAGEARADTTAAGGGQVPAVTAGAEAAGRREAGAKPGENAQDMIARGREIVQDQGCIACHTLDGTVTIGSSLKGLFGSVSTVVTGGRERRVTVDEAYLRRSILQPKEDIVKGFKPLMPSQRGLLSDEELDAIVAYIKSIGVSHE